MRCFAHRLYRFAQLCGRQALSLHDEEMKRRHLTESQRAMIAANLANMPRGGDRPSASDSNFDSANLHIRKEVSQSDAAEMLQVSPRSVATAAKIEREAPEEVA